MFVGPWLALIFLTTESSQPLAVVRNSERAHSDQANILTWDVGGDLRLDISKNMIGC